MHGLATTRIDQSMTGDNGVKPGWSDLPDDLLNAIYLRCSSRYDRARFASVCTSWRAVTSWHPALPSLPLLLASTGNGKLDRKARAYSPEDGGAVRVPWFPWGKQFVGSHDGGWVAAATGSLLLIVNVFSGVWVPLSVKQRILACRCPTRWLEFGAGFKISFKKIVFSEDPSSSSCILAALTTRCKIALCRVGCQNTGWTTRGCSSGMFEGIVDIVFSKGELYGIKSNGLLFKYGINLKEDGAPVATSLDQLTLRCPIMDVYHVWFHAKYIFELESRLATAGIARTRSGWRYLEGYFFMVFVLVKDDDMRPPFNYKWIETTSLGEHALFLGPSCSKAVHMSAAGGTRGGVMRNHIYYHEHHFSRDDEEFTQGLELDLGSCAIYCQENENMHGMKRIKSRGYHYHEDDGTKGCLWFLPPDS